MKKVFIVLLLLLLPFKVFAYNISDFEVKREYYFNKLEKKLYNKLYNFSDSNTIKLNGLIEKRIEKYEDSLNMDDNLKLKNLAILYALKDIIKKVKAEKSELINNELKIKVIDDKRCITCNTDEIVENFKEISYIKWAKFEKFDFKDKQVEEYLKYNNIIKLPAIILSNNDIEDDNTMKPYLTKLRSWEYLLNIGSLFNPFLERSDRWYLTVDSDMLDTIKETSYINWNKNADVTWIEYSDIECPYCAKLHKDWTEDQIIEKYKWKVNIIFQHFPLDFHENALPWAEVLECTSEQLWNNSFYELLEIYYNTQWLTFDIMVEKAEELWANLEELNKCYEDAKYTDKINNQMKIWNTVFWVSWTPWNVFVNNKTKEYIVVPWALSVEIFESIINEIIK